MDKEKCIVDSHGEDVMRIQTKFFKTIVSKAVEKAIVSNLGCTADIHVNDLFLSHKADLTSVNLNISLLINDNELAKIIFDLL